MAHLGRPDSDRHRLAARQCETRKALLVATASGLLGLLTNQIIGLAWSHPGLS
jgi:hypothetical protein